jgi:hypothetical protein
MSEADLAKPSARASKATSVFNGRAMTSVTTMAS